MDFYDFGPFRLDSLNRELLHEGRRVPLTPRAMDTLLALVQQAGQVVEKEALLRQVWPGTFVAEATLTQNVYTIRKALGSFGQGTPYIETLPRRGYRFTAPVTCSPMPAIAATDPRAGIRSLAVLPFVVIGSGELDRFVGLGMADALITRLSGLQPTTVRPTSAVMGFAERPHDSLETGRKLGVDAVLEGRVQVAGERTRVTVQLVRVREGSSLWADSFDVVFTDLLSVQEEIATRVVETLQLRLTATAGKRRTRPATVDAGAHQAYVKGRYHWNQRSNESLRIAIRHFEEALRRDECYSLAHAGLADSYALLPLYGEERPREAYPKAKQAAQRALECDDANAEAHTSMAYVHLFYDWNWRHAEATFQRAIELNPGYSTAHHWLAFLHSARGRHDEAVAGGMRALELEPLSLAINSDLGLLLYFARRYDEATSQFQVALELNPRFAYALFGLGLVHAQSGRADHAVRDALRAVELSNDGSTMLAALGYAYAVAGRREQALEVLHRIETLPGGEQAFADRAALIYSGLGESEKALERLAMACHERSRFVIFLGVWPAFDSLRAEPEFVRLIQRIDSEGQL